MTVRIQSHKAKNPPSKHGNGSAQVGGDYERPEEAMGCCLSHSEAIVFGFIQVKSHLAFALFLLTAIWLVPFREDAAKRYVPQRSTPCWREQAC